MEFKILFEKQKELDIAIQEKHDLTYEETFEERFLALYVELGELANATRCFKYWSNKPSEGKERVMDEFADCLHFLLSVGIACSIIKTQYDVSNNELNLTKQIILTYELINEFHEKKDEKSYELLFKSFLAIALKLDMSEQDIINSYLLKLNVNYQRQENNY